MGTLIALLGGPITGLLGSAFGIFGKWLEHKQDLEKTAITNAQEIELQKLNIAARGQEIEQEALIAQTSAMSKMLKSSYQHDIGGGQASQSVINVLRLMRPLFTILLILLSGLIFFYSTEGDLIDGQPIREHVVLTILYMTEVAVTWWFADRARSSKK